MFAEVVPIRRTPFGLDGFDYTFDEREEYQVGQLVYVSLRGHKTEGIIRHIKSTSAFAAQAKPLLGPLSVSFVLPIGCLELLNWVAERTFTSLPTVLHAWLGTLPKRFSDGPNEPLAHSTQPTLSKPTPGAISAHWYVDHEARLVKRAREALKQGKRVLILTPWTHRVERFVEAVRDITQNASPLHGDLAHGAYFSHWSSFVTGGCSCLVATRLGAWLSPAADLILIDEPENDDHKQDEQAPRYDARRVASWATKYAGVDLEVFGLTPPLHTEASTPDLTCNIRVHPFHPKGRSSIPTLQADSLLALREHTGPNIIVHPIRGIAARLTCRDCGWQAPCERCGAPLSAYEDRTQCRTCGNVQDLPLTCASCDGTDLGKATPGVERLKRAWERFEPDQPVEWRDTTSLSLEQPIPSHALVVVTLGHLVGGAIEDVRRTERQVIAARRLMKRVQEAQGRLIIQSRESDISLWQIWQTGTGVQATYAQELETRRVFRYPPTWRRVKCLVDGHETEVQTWIRQAKDLIQRTGELEGPFPVLFRRPGSPARFVVHLLFSPEIAEAQLVTLLRPLADRALIDLDPIAFFK